MTSGLAKDVDAVNQLGGFEVKAHGHWRSVRANVKAGKVVSMRADVSTSSADFCALSAGTVFKACQAGRSDLSGDGEPRLCRLDSRPVGRHRGSGLYVCRCFQSPSIGWVLRRTGSGSWFSIHVRALASATSSF